MCRDRRRRRNRRERARNPAKAVRSTIRRVSVGVTSRRDVGFCREAAIQNSPGVQPWVRWLVKGALKVAADVGRADGITRDSPFRVNNVVENEDEDDDEYENE